MRMVFIQCGGTIDKCYPRRTKGYAFEFDEFSAAQNILTIDLNEMINFKPIFITVCKTDSLEMDNTDRDKIVDAIAAASIKHNTNLFVITHGTDTMIQTA
eukprot:UN04453